MADFTIITELLDLLTTANISAYIPEEKRGPCTASYVVVRDAGQFIQTKGLGWKTIELLCYVPKNKYASMDTLKASVYGAIDATDWVKRTGQELPMIYLDYIDGWMAVIECRVYKAL